MRWSGILSAACAIFLALAVPSHAQIPTEVPLGAKGQIHVRVQEGGGSPFGRLAIVTLRSSSWLTNSTTSTSDAGQALFTGLPAGQYVVEVSAPGYRTAQEQATITADGETENVFVVMVVDSSQSASVPPSAVSAVLSPKALKETEKGLLALQRSNLDEAEVHLKRALQIAPGFPDVQ